MEAYREEMRGFYLTTEELPGPIVKTETELVEAIRSGAAGGTERAAFNARFNALNDGHAAQRLTERVIGPGTKKEERE